MLVKDTPKSDVDRIVEGIRDLRPGWKMSIVEDDVLRQIGLSTETLCTILIDATDEEIDALIDEVDQMKIDAYNFRNEDLKDPAIAKRQKELELRYREYSILEAYLSGRY